jgi:CRP/FNR family transcriptional regulator
MTPNDAQMFQELKMLNTATATAAATVAAPSRAATAVSSAPSPALAHTWRTDEAANERASQHIAATLKLLSETLRPQRRIVHAGDTIYQAGERFCHLYILNSGFYKLVNLSPDGREQVVGLKFRGDWLGFDGIANGQYACDAVAMDTGEVWVVRYDTLLTACTGTPGLLTAMHEAMSREIAGDRDSLMSVCTLPADARVAEFLRNWAQSLARRGLRTDQITLRMTRAEIGNYLGMTLETVSRALSRLARCSLIEFAEKGRREIRIPQVDALGEFVQSSVAPATVATLQ